MGLQDRDWYRDIYQQKRATPGRRRPGSPPPLRLATRSSSTATVWILMATLAAIAVGGFLLIQHRPHGVPASRIAVPTDEQPAPVVANLPRIAGCLQAAACQCVTERGTPVELPRAECEAIAGGGR
ncbi:MAG: hypothetical protein MZV65_49345 [Chromatiales bacterium]|nr:hypothetical protein [Chromatiales bacterium]